MTATETEEKPKPKYTLHFTSVTVEQLNNNPPPWRQVVYNDPLRHVYELKATRDGVASYRPTRAETRRDRRRILSLTKRPSPWKKER